MPCRRLFLAEKLTPKVNDNITQTNKQAITTYTTYTTHKHKQTTCSEGVIPMLPDIDGLRENVPAAALRPSESEQTTYIYIYM